MSTRSMVQFGYMDKDKFQRSAQIYHHYDGYPSSRLVDIAMTIAEANKNYEGGFAYRKQTTYPTDLAAFYVLVNKDGAGGVEIDENIHGDIEYLYQVWQDDSSLFHVAIYEPAGDKFWDNPEMQYLTKSDEGSLPSLLKKYKEIQQ